MPNKILIAVVFIFFLTPMIFTQSVFERWHKTDQLIRDRKIDEDAAMDSIVMYVKLGKQEFRSYVIPGTKRSDWVFPMSDFTWYSYRSDGKDYKDEFFSYFQGGEFKGHPAHDIFIIDKDTNSFEDSTGRQVPAIAMVTGIVLSTYDTWFRADFLRSGNYIKLFDPESEAIFYYSHLDSVFVKPGQLVIAGDKIGYIGRTGRKAIRGKTHIHIAYYKIDDGDPVPEDILNDLYKAQSRMKK
ncbi:MAG TPA: M23 family metallopeptidase [Ignavibacteria bacterium]|nr:M23 family metallopeptidase [Ignavibacteria bacterium]